MPKRKRTQEFLFILAILLSPACGLAQEVEKQIRSTTGPQELTVDEVLNWLPSDTETVFTVNGPFKIDVPDEKAPPINVPLEKTLQALGVGELFPTRPLRKSPLMKERIAFAIEGSRRFRAPRGLGMMPYEGCSIVVFERDPGAARDAYFRALAQQGATSTRIGGQKVVCGSEKMEEDTWKFFVAQPRPKVVLVATDEQYLTEVLKRMTHKQAKRALPADLPEWRQLDPKATIWAIRHYDPANAATDPSSPLTAEKRAANQPDLQAIGLTFSYIPGKNSSAVVRYLSSNPAALAVVKREWTHD